MVLCTEIVGKGFLQFVFSCRFFVTQGKGRGHIFPGGEFQTTPVRLDKHNPRKGESGYVTLPLEFIFLRLVAPRLFNYTARYCTRILGYGMRSWTNCCT
ncbi:hypothetical protein L873DRAFT_233228 [Choiromyces venosus 120613-1]|uniref:Uncharacterized protein n=1 Tax=Choiromyces venosus 120613-1 TaxID=1336337 RepID=A0A3N4JY98_9PEZI|nr:hypothetical protein L873DRAFT_233027 [Choiromyces venosus 120613-1]RPB03344.1 hypothetical protein L873DRAFT_233228 [Choiromyces venosus 120613-1]